MQVSENYATRRATEIAARLSALQARLMPLGAPVEVKLPALALVPATVKAVAPSIPYGDPRDAETYFPFGVEEAPEEIETAPYDSTPAPLWAVERAGHLADAEAIAREFRIQRQRKAAALVEVETAPFRFGFDDLPAEYFAATAPELSAPLALPLAA